MASPSHKTGGSSVHHILRKVPGNFRQVGSSLKVSYFVGGSSEQLSESNSSKMTSVLFAVHVYRAEPPCGMHLSETKHCTPPLGLSQTEWCGSTNCCWQKQTGGGGQGVFFVGAVRLVADTMAITKRDGIGLVSIACLRT